MSDYDDDDTYDFEGSDEEEFIESPDTADADFELPAISVKGKSKDILFQSLTPSELGAMMDADVQRVVNLCGLECSVAAILCRHFRWNTEKLLEKYMDSSSSVMKLVGESTSYWDDHGSKPGPPKRARTRSITEFECDICCCNPGEENAYKPRCGHKYCRECWECYILSKVKDEGKCHLTCMHGKCSVVLTDSDVKEVCGSSVYERYRELLCQSYVNDSSHLRFCPFPGCDNTVSCRDVTKSSLSTVVPIVTCNAGHNFCFGCSAEAHRPAICSVVGLWLTQARDDVGTSEWLKANTRRCPKCEQYIEKNGGCNRILCRHCQHQFCWVCSASWDKHGYQNKSCNAFTEPMKSDPETQAKANLERWLFYFDRWNNHELSARLDEQLYERAEERIKEVQVASGLSWIQAQFMKEAVEELTRCRVTLKWSYTMAFYLKPGNSKQIFEDIQADLEKAVEDLSQLLEEEILEDTVHSLRQRMLDKTVYVQKRHQIVIEDTASGLVEGRWEWTVPVD